MVTAVEDETGDSLSNLFSDRLISLDTLDKESCFLLSGGNSAEGKDHMVCVEVNKITVSINRNDIRRPILREDTLNSS